MLDVILVLLEAAAYAFLLIFIAILGLTVLIGVPVYCIAKLIGLATRTYGRRTNLDEMLERTYNPALDGPIDYAKWGGTARSQLDQDADIYSLTVRGARASK
jgi:hypothetical protein